jgi:glycosyltransferase involved in cell wall biosynthesis
MPIHILDVVNLSNGRNLDADSGLRLKHEFLRHSLRQRPDLFFHLVVARDLPEWFTCHLPGRVRLIHTDLVTRQRGGAFQFDPEVLAELIDLRHYEIDLVWLNQPELVNAYLFLLNRAHFLDVHSFCYVHWMDWRRWGNVRNRRNEAGNLAAIGGMLASRLVGCNSEFGRQKILKAAKPWLSDEAHKGLEDRLIPLYPGVDARALRSARTSKVSGKVKTLVFPYRALRYTGFPYLVGHLRKLWQRRRDFRLLLTDPSHCHAIQRLGERLPFVEVLDLSRPEYLRVLWEADIVLGMHNGWNQWSLAAVEALAYNCMPLFSSEAFFPEMLRNCCADDEWPLVRRLFLFYRSEFTERLSDLLDDDGEARMLTARLARRARTFYAWEQRIQAWSRCLDLVDAAVPSVTARSKTADELVRHVTRSGGCGKADLLRAMQWHIRTRQVPWSRYRKHLRANVADNIDADGRAIYAPP